MKLHCSQTKLSIGIQINGSSFAVVAEDLFEEQRQRTCHPERNKRYDMFVEAKLACAKDRMCSGLIKTPQKRGRDLKSPIPGVTMNQDEFFLCDYPPYSKPSDDNTLFRKRGNQLFPTFKTNIFARGPELTPP